jgi:PiT family inorganic phosphate transporter
MSAALLLLLVVILVVLAFEYINGFHDTANAIATVVSTKVLTPRQALVLASLMNLVGSFMGQSVAKTIQGGILDDKVVQVTSLVILAAMLGAIAWNLITWWFGMPSSSSHALIGGLIGAGLAKANMNFGILIWSRDKGDAKHTMEGIYHKVVIPMIGSPLLGLSVAYCRSSAPDTWASDTARPTPRKPWASSCSPWWVRRPRATLTPFPPGLIS